MKKAIVISNIGTLDVRAITMMGLTNKRDDAEKIGMFGTGLKYSLAKLLRDRIPFRLWNGEREVTFAVQAGEFRGKPYEQMLVDDQATGVTTDMGPQWEPWWIIREIYSNALDEGAMEFYQCDAEQVEFRAGFTTWVLDAEHFGQVYAAREMYFPRERSPLWETPTLRVLPRFTNRGTRIYKQGVLVMEAMTDDACDYDLLTVELNEMREPRYSGLIPLDITEELMRSAPSREWVSLYVSQINSLLRSGRQCFTGSIYSSRKGKFELSDAWCSMAADPMVNVYDVDSVYGEVPRDGFILPSDLAEAMQPHMHADAVKTDVDPDDAQRAMLDNLLPKMYAAGVEVRVPIKVNPAMPSTTMGEARGNMIVLSPRAFDTPHLLLTVLLEECTHIRTGYNDRTREFQTAAFEGWAESILTLTLNTNQ